MEKTSPLDPKDVKWANETLKFIVAILQGKAAICTVKGRIQIALILKNRLAEKGFWWQVKVAEHWIHRAQGGDFSP